jgi:hypothetical protein
MSEVRVNKLSPRSGTTVTLGDSGDTITLPAGVTLANSGTFTNFQSTGIDDNATSTAITINSSEQVGIGTTSPSALLHVDSGNSGVTPNGNADDLFIENNGAAGITIGSSTSEKGNIFFADSGNALDGYIQYAHDSRYLRFATATLERLRIDSSGNVGIGNSIPGNFNAGANNLVVGSGSGDEGITIYSGSANKGNIYFADASTGTGEYTGFIDYQHSTDSLRFGTNGGITRMVIDSSGNVGIGTTSQANKLEVSGAIVSQGAVDSYTNDGLYLSNEGSSIFKIGAWRSGANASVLTFGTDSGSDTAPVERMRIDSSGNVLIAKTSPSSATTGLELDVAGFFQATRNGTLGLFNRITTDGTLFSFRQNGSEEGTISVSGTTVSYNGFTGTHWSRFTDNSKPTILKGTVLETLDEMCDWYNLEFDVITQDADGNDVTTTEKVPHVLTDTQSNGDVITYNHEGTDYQATIVKETDIKHMKSKVSDTVDAKNVYGVFVAYDEDGEGYNDFYVASVGSFVVRIKANETIAKGDLLQSNGDGTAKVQTDDNIKSSSFAKVLSTTIIETYEDGSYLVPCSLMC